MKRLFLSSLFAAALGWIASSASAQGIPPNPLVPKPSKKTETRPLGGGAGNVEAGLSGSTRATKTVVVEYQAVTPLRNWTNLEGKKIEARLLAWSVPAPGKTGPVEVVRDGKVRFLIPGKPRPVEYPKDQLEDDDQIEIERIVEAAALGVKPREGEVKERDSEESAEEE